MTKEKQRINHWTAFLIALGIAIVMFLPFVVMDKGCFFYYGDFNVQQIPFYRLAHEAVRGGDFFWSWNTDLGANFIGSYSFYLLFSPFFWLTIPFPVEALPYLMAPLLALKIATAAFTSYFFIRRFVKENMSALLGALLYAFSGYMVYNVFFNHFLEVVAFFPLILIGLEELMVNNRRGFFALAVALNAMVNYWFFIGEVVFVIIYFFVRSTSPQWRLTVGSFFKVAFEALLGVGLAMAVLLPSAIALLGNPRTGAEKLLDGWNLWLYGHPQRLPAILHSLFFPPDLPALSNFFPDHGAKWASLSAYLPLFGVTGVITYFAARKKDWLKKMLVISLLMALIPGLNALFVMLNDSYYARWLYMPILLMAVATAIALEDREMDWTPGIKVSVVVVGVITLAVGLTPMLGKEGTLTFGLYKYVALYLVSVVLAVCGLVLTLLLRGKMHAGPKGRAVVLASVSVFSLVFGIATIASGRISYPNNEWIPEAGLRGRDEIHTPDDTFARSDFFQCDDNLGMYWMRPNIQAFHSVVPVSIMEFYPSVGVKRDVSSKPDEEHYPLRSLLSVRWLFIEEGKENQSPMPGFTLFDNQLGYNIYENNHFLPMGFAYDYYVNEDDFYYTAENMRCRLLLRAIEMDADTITRNHDIIGPLNSDQLSAFSDDDFEQDVADRRGMAAYFFEKDNNGFTSKIDLDAERMVFFSVPYEQGWSATVNGQTALVEKASIGFMAVRVPAGDSTIRFTYQTPGLRLGLVISGGTLLALLIYLLLAKLFCPRRKVVENDAPPPAPAPVIDREGEKLAELLSPPKAPVSQPPVPIPLAEVESREKLSVEPPEELPPPQEAAEPPRPEPKAPPEVRPLRPTPMHKLRGQERGAADSQTAPKIRPEPELPIAAPPKLREPDWQDFQRAPAPPPPKPAEEARPQERAKVEAEPKTEPKTEPKAVSTLEEAMRMARKRLEEPSDSE